MPYKLQTHPTQPRGGHPSHSNLVRGKLTSPTPNPAGDGTSGLTSYPRRRSKVSEATCLRPQRSAPSRTRTRAVRPRVQRSDHWATHAPQIIIIIVSVIIYQGQDNWLYQISWRSTNVQNVSSRTEVSTVANLHYQLTWLNQIMIFYLFIITGVS